jgi:hypothetical protein
MSNNYKSPGKKIAEISKAFHILIIFLAVLTSMVGCTFVVAEEGAGGPFIFLGLAMILVSSIYKSFVDAFACLVEDTSIMKENLCELRKDLAKIIENK